MHPIQLTLRAGALPTQGKLHRLERKWQTLVSKRPEWRVLRQSPLRGGRVTPQYSEARGSRTSRIGVRHGQPAHSSPRGLPEISLRAPRLPPALQVRSYVRTYSERAARVHDGQLEVPGTPVKWAVTIPCLDRHYAPKATLSYNTSTLKVFERPSVMSQIRQLRSTIPPSIVYVRT